AARETRRMARWRRANGARQRRGNGDHAAAGGSRAMNSADLRGPLAASVSRSFYLTIRILPRELRGPIGLAYLLARASDTIADSADAPVAGMMPHLAALYAMIREAGRGGLADLQREISPPHAGERELIAK